MPLVVRASAHDFQAQRPVGEGTVGVRQPGGDGIAIDLAAGCTG
nr:F293 [uncultured bacterium]